MSPMLTSGMTSSVSKEWGTPDSVFDPLNELYDFTLDGAASHINAKVARYCTADGTFYRDPQGTQQLISDLDGLQFPWKGERVFLNPPWGEGEGPCDEGCTKKTCRERGWHTAVYLPGIDDFLLKVRNEYLRNNVLVACVLPARPDTGWFHDYVLPYARLQWRRGRVKYIDPEGEARRARGEKPREGPPVGTLIAIYR